jgi:signal transduction histidine kinase
MTRLRQLMAGVRARTTVAAVLVVGAALIIAGAGMVWKLRGDLTTNIRDAAELSALSIAESIEQGELVDPIAVGDEDEEFAQVVDAGGDVVASTTNLPDRNPVVDIAPNETKRVEVPAVEDYPFIVVGEQAVLSDGSTQTVLVGRTLEPVAESVDAVLRSMAIGIPVLMLVVAAVTWVVVGRALAPVEAIRSEVQTISGERLDRRVPVPPADDEIAHLATTMNTMLDRLEEGRDRQRRLVSDASHELRSPIAAIRQHVEVALAHPEQSDDAELAEVVLAEDLRLQRMVEDLLLLTKIDEGTLALRRSQVDLDDIVLAEATRLRAADPGVRIDTRGVSACRVLGDEAHLERLVRNLTDNAIRHARKAITVSLYQVADDAVLTIDDDGAGVPIRDRERIFERFERLDEARDRDSGGTGLGLSIVREIANAHRGTVTVSDAPTGGARFEVRLPLDTQG